MRVQFNHTAQWQNEEMNKSNVENVKTGSKHLDCP